MQNKNGLTLWKTLLVMVSFSIATARADSSEPVPTPGASAPENSSSGIFGFNLTTTISGIYDTNPAESGGYFEGGLSPSQGAGGPNDQGGQQGGGAGPGGGSAGTSGGRAPGQMPPGQTSLVSSSVPADYSLATDLDLSRELLSGDASWTIGTYGFASFFQTQKSYNYDSAKLYTSYTSPGQGMFWRTNLSYLETWYGGAHSQNYLSLAPGLTFRFGSKWKLAVDFSVTRETYASLSWNYQPSATLDFYPSESIKIYLTGSYLSANGTQAVISGTTSPPTITSGTLFSNYTTPSVTLGTDFDTILGLTVNVWGGLALTSYAAENLPAVQNAPPPTGNRSDTLSSTGASLKHGLFFNWLTAKFEVAFYNNVSSGFNGGQLVSTSIPNYTYQRSVYSAALMGSF